MAEQPEHAPVATPAVLYAAKSTEDVRGSIPTQIADCRTAAEREGREVVAEHRDEAASAFKGNRGTGLTDAKNDAIRLGAELWVQHSDRLARGDGITADHLAEVWFALRRHGVRLRSVQDNSNLEDAIRVVLIGERNHEDSARKSAATRDGLKRRKDSGLPVGALPEGYTVQATIADGRPITTRVVDEKRMDNIVMRAMDLVESGFTFGDVSRRFNAEGLRTRRDKQFTTRAIRKMVLNPDYTGSTGYPQVIDRERHKRIVGSLKRMDPVAVQSRCKGNKPTEEYLLRGIGSCARCGSSLYGRRYKRVPGERAYICAAVKEARGTCDAEKIPALPVEKAVIDHLHLFLDDVEQWINDRAQEANTDRDDFANALKGQQTKLRNLTVKIEKAREQWERLLGEDDGASDTALRGVKRLEDEAAHLADDLSRMSERLAGWPTPDVDAALDFYSELRDTIHGRVRAAKGFEDLQAALKSILAKVALKVSPDGTAVAGTFELAGADVEAGKVPMMVHAGWRIDDPDSNPLLMTRDRDGRAVPSNNDPWADRDARPWCRTSR